MQATKFIVAVALLSLALLADARESKPERSPRRERSRPEQPEKAPPPPRAPTSPPRVVSRTHVVNWDNLFTAPKLLTVGCQDQIRFQWSTGFHDVVEVDVKDARITHPPRFPSICHIDGDKKMFPHIIKPTNKASQVFRMGKLGVRSFISDQPGQCSKGYGITIVTRENGRPCEGSSSGSSP